MKVKRSYAIPPHIDQWLRALSDKTGESVSALVTQFLKAAKDGERLRDGP